MNLAGLPATTASSATSFVTTLPAPTKAFLPIRTAGRIVEFAPSLADSSKTRLDSANLAGGLILSETEHILADYVELWEQNARALLVAH